MNWKILSFVVLIVLTLAIVAYDVDLYAVPSKLYMSSGKWAEPVPSWIDTLPYTTLDNVSYFERSQIIDYLKSGDIIGNSIDLSDEWCPIRNWAESMYNRYLKPRDVGGNTYYDALFNVKVEDDYYQVLLWRKKMYNPLGLEYHFNAILNVLTVSLWIVFVHSALRKRDQT